MTTIAIRSLLRSGRRSLVPVESVVPDGRRFHSVEGAIELTIGATPVLTVREWDDVRDLWSSIVGAGSTSSITWSGSVPVRGTTGWTARPW